MLKHLVDRVEKLTFDETAKLADSWFDRDGKPLLQTSATSVNEVASSAPPQRPSSTASAAASTPAAPPVAASGQTDEEGDINAIRFRQGQKQQFNINNRGGRGRGRGNSNNSGNRNQNNNTNSYGNSASYSNASGSSKKKVCDFHIKFGEEARRCEEWCLMWKQHSAAKGKPAPRA